MSSNAQIVPHVITVDVEDWYQSTVDAAAPISDRFCKSTRAVMEAMAKRGVKGTFFVLGLAAEKNPSIVRELAAAGHEVQSHGYGHVEVFKLTEDQFRQDLLRAKGLLEDLIGRPITGFRAPSFSIDHRTPWAFDVLAQTGHRYDSSIFPMQMRRYGVKGFALVPQIVTTPFGAQLVEAPVAVAEFAGRRWPVGGGGYFRLWPYGLLRRAFAGLVRQQRPGVVYFHPYEYDADEMAYYKDQLSLKLRLHQGLGRKGFPRKVDCFLRDFRVVTLGELLAPLVNQLPA